jgi:hypothetical protein
VIFLIAPQSKPVRKALSGDTSRRSRNLLSFLRGLEELPEVCGARLPQERVDVVLWPSG